MRISIAILIIALIASLTNAGQPMLPAKKLIFLLLHGEAGKGNSETSKIFTDVKRSIELEYNVEGRVFCYQMENPAGDMDSWIEEISSDSNPTSFMKRAMKECRERIAYETGLTDSIALDAATPKEFVIFAHSFAGLAVRRYICSNEYRGDIRMLITLSTPNEGTEYPHILEILETRTALKRIKSVANKAIKSVDAKGELLKSLETAYELRKAYASVTELIDGVKKLIKEFKEARDRLTEATNALKESANELNPQEIISTIQNTVDAAKTTFQSPPNIDWNALKNLKSIFVDSITAQLKESSVMDLYTLMKDLDSCANGQLASLLSDFNSNRAILENAFSVETFLREFNPEKLKNYGVSTDFSRYYAAAACIIRKPEILFQYSTNIPELYQQVKSVISYKDSFDLNPENLISFELKPHPKTYLRRLQQLKSVQLVPVVMNVKNDILTLADMELELSNLISAVSTGKNIASQVRTTYATLKDYNLNAEIDTVKAVVSDLRKFRAAPDLTRLKAQVNILKRGVSAVTALKDFKPQFSVQININVPGMECQLQDAILAFKEIKAALQKGYKPQCAKSYVKRLSAFFALLEVPKIEMPKLRFPGLDKIAIASPELFEEVINIFGITQYVTSIIEAASTIKNVYAEIKSMSEEIETLVAQFSGEAKDEGAMLQASLDYAISLGMMAFSFAKMLPKTIENSSSQAAALSTIGKKLAKALMKELWKEIESGGLLEVGFAEAMRSKSAPSASDAVMASMSVDSDSLKKLISAMPLNFADSALNQTKYRIVVTKGVITPTRDGSKALDFVAGGGGTEGMLRAQIQATMDKLVKQATEEVRKKITDEITKATVKLSDKMKNDIAESMKNGGKLKESLIKAGGSEEDYKKLTEIIQSVLSGVAETVGAQLADKLAAMGANAVVKVAEKLAKLEPVQKAWEKLAVLDAINPATVISIYNTVLKVADDDRGLPLIIAATYFSPLLKLGLYENGDFISSAKSQRGENCALFQSAKDVKRTVIDVDHPLAPFAGIAILGTGMDIAALLAPDPASKESIRITKIITVNLLSAGIAISKKEELQEYFVNSHNKAVHHLENKSNLDTQLFDTPSVSVKIPNAVKK